jgi:uncharacterized protein YndB with AHSA1/START domain
MRRRTGELTLRLSRVIRAPRERVFQAWTDPDDITKWWGRPWESAVPAAEVNLRVGGTYRITMRFGWHEVAVVGTFLEVESPSRLVYTLAWERMPRLAEEMQVSVEFHERGEDTEVVVTHRDLSGRTARAYHRLGWKSGLDRLRRLCETNGRAHETGFVGRRT